jgi:hypothetical protein
VVTTRLEFLSAPLLVRNVIDDVDATGDRVAIKEPPLKSYAT